MHAGAAVPPRDAPRGPCRREDVDELTQLVAAGIEQGSGFPEIRPVVDHYEAHRLPALPWAPQEGQATERPSAEDRSRRVHPASLLPRLMYLTPVMLPTTAIGEAVGIAVRGQGVRDAPAHLCFRQERGHATHDHRIVAE